MASVHAQRLCPDAVFLPGDMSTYVEYSERVFAVFADFTPLVEGISVDEAFLDVTGARGLYGSGVVIGQRIRDRVREEVGLPCSVGVASNKFVAKLASEHAKPVATADGVQPGLGVMEVPAGSEVDFVQRLPVSVLWGVGPATLEKLTHVGVTRVADLAAINSAVLSHLVGIAHAQHLINLANAVDDRPVSPRQESRSIGHEETFAHDISDRVELRVHLVRLVDAVMQRVRGESLAARTVTVKIKYADFRVITRSRTVDHALTTAQSVAAIAEGILAGVDLHDGVRLLGVSLRNFTEGAEQLQLFGTDDAESLEDVWTPATAAIDDIRRRFGDDSITTASALGALRRPGHWGPAVEEE